MNRNACAAIISAYILIFDFPPFAWSEPMARFNQLVLKKAELENRYGVETLECFTFQDNIGSNKDQAELVNRCLKGIETLASAMAEVPDAGINMIGVSNRFLRTAGFKTILVTWDASKGEIKHFLKERLSPE